MKTCIVEGCPYNVFSNGYCRNHVYIYYNSKSMHQGIKNNAINPQSVKRIEVNRLYFALCKALKEQMIRDGKFSCIFCGEKLESDCDWHHTNGRDGDMILAKHYLKPSHRLCHTKYHSSNYTQLEKEKWFMAFLWRLKEIDEALYDKEINKQFKI